MLVMLNTLTLYELYTICTSIDLKHSGARDGVSGQFSICAMSIHIFTSRRIFIPCLSPHQSQQEDPA